MAEYLGELHKHETGEMLSLYVSLVVQRPLFVLRYKVDRMLGHVLTIPVFEDLKLMTYDGHDT